MHLLNALEQLQQDY
ncbi:MbeD/MobD family mobilization/exclusion protein, partial [Shigella dysenteriae]